MRLQLSFLKIFLWSEICLSVGPANHSISRGTTPVLCICPPCQSLKLPRCGCMPPEWFARSATTPHCLLRWVPKAGFAVHCRLWCLGHLWFVQQSAPCRRGRSVCATSTACRRFSDRNGFVGAGAQGLQLQWRLCLPGLPSTLTARLRPRSGGMSDTGCQHCLHLSHANSLKEKPFDFIAPHRRLANRAGVFAV